MASKLKKPIKREIRVEGMDEAIIASFTESTVEMSLPSFKVKLFCTWSEIVAKSMHTPKNVPSFLEGRPMDFLKHQAKKLDEKKKTKIKKEVT